MNLKPGDKVMCYSSVGEQEVTVLEPGLSVETLLVPSKQPNMVLVQYPNGGKGLAHEKQLYRIGIAKGEK